MNRVDVSAAILKIAKEILGADLNELDGRQTAFLSDELKALLNEQVSYEMYSAYVYFMVAAWCQSKGLIGFEKWFKSQGDGEIEHAMKVYKHLVETGSNVNLPGVPPPVKALSFESMEDATRAVLDHEMTVTRKWEAIGALVKNERNLATQQLAQWFAVEQVEEEDAAVTLHQKVQLAEGGAGLLVIDAELRGAGPAASAKTASVSEISQMLTRAYSTLQDAKKRLLPKAAGLMTPGEIEDFTNAADDLSGECSMFAAHLEQLIEEKRA